MYLERAFWIIALVLCSRKVKNHCIAHSHSSQALFSELLHRVYMNGEWDFGGRQ